MTKVFASVVLPLFLAACGGGDSGVATSVPSVGPTPTTTPTTIPYIGVNYLQDLNAAPYRASYLDNGVGIAGTVTFGQSAVTATMTPLADGGVAYGAPLNFGVATGSNASNKNLPVVAMLCRNIKGTGTAGRKSTDVLVAASATRLLSASELAGQRFNIYREDCYEVGTSPGATPLNGSYVFDANGNATVTDQSGTAQYSAATVTSALNGQPAYTSAIGKYEVIFAYKYSKADGSSAYAIVSHVAPVPNGLTKGDVATFTQQ